MENPCKTRTSLMALGISFHAQKKVFGDHPQGEKLYSSRLIGFTEKLHGLDNQVRKDSSAQVLMGILLYLEFLVDFVEAFRVVRQLDPDVLGPDEDRLQVRPVALYLEPRRQHLVRSRQLVLPRRDFFQKVVDIL